MVLTKLANNRLYANFKNKMPKQVYYTVSDELKSKGNRNCYFYSGHWEHIFVFFVVCDVVPVNLYMSVISMNCELNVFFKKIVIIDLKAFC